MKKVARFLGKLYGMFKFRKFKSIKLSGGKLFDDELFTKMDNIYSSDLEERKIVNKKLKEEKEKDEYRENISLAVERFIKSNGSDYKNIIEKMINNSLEDQVFEFIQNNDKIPVESRAYLLNQFLDRKISKDKKVEIIEEKEPVKKTSKETANNVNSIIVEFLSDVNINDRKNATKISTISELMSKLINSDNKKLVDELEDWTTECKSMNSDLKCDALIEELQTLLVSTNKKEIKEENKNTIDDSKNKLEAIKNDIENAKTIEELQTSIEEINNTYSSALENNKISLISECTKLLNMVKAKKEEIISNSKTVDEPVKQDIPQITKIADEPVKEEIKKTNTSEAQVSKAANLEEKEEIKESTKLQTVYNRYNELQNKLNDKINELEYLNKEYNCLEKAVYGIKLEDYPDSFFELKKQKALLSSKEDMENLKGKLGEIKRVKEEIELLTKKISIYYEKYGVDINDKYRESYSNDYNKAIELKERKDRLQESVDFYNNFSESEMETIYKYMSYQKTL